AGTSGSSASGHHTNCHSRAAAAAASTTQVTSSTYPPRANGRRQQFTQVSFASGGHGASIKTLPAVGRHPADRLHWAPESPLVRVDGWGAGLLPCFEDRIADAPGGFHLVGSGEQAGVPLESIQ